jgi:hypothetical protein
VRIYISHGADPGDWFVVKPAIGDRAKARKKITPTLAVQSLLSAGRTVYTIDARPYAGDQREPRRRWWQRG